MKIAAIMPCRGRAEQTARNVRRLLATAGDVEWQLICMIDRDPVVNEALSSADLPVWRMATPQPGYWHALQQATDYWRVEFTHLINLANDLLPGQHWLQRAAGAYRETFGDGPGLLGLNDGHHETGHSCHFLISRSLLDDYGGWPVWYDHNFGDTELCQRAIADGLYAKAPWATLFHDHPYFGGADDATYAEGRAQVERDGRLYEERRARGWPTISR
jgi:hypothetical protein